jgi:hypothetical protein
MHGARGRGLNRLVVRRVCFVVPLRGTSCLRCCSVGVAHGYIVLPLRGGEHPHPPSQSLGHPLPAELGEGLSSIDRGHVAVGVAEELAHDGGEGLLEELDGLVAGALGGLGGDEGLELDEGAEAVDLVEVDADV